MLNIHRAGFRWTKRPGVGLGAIAFSLSALLLSSCQGTSPTDDIQEGRTNVTSEDVVNDNTELVGQEITVRNLIGETIGTNAFTLDEGGEPILVIDATGIPFTPPTEEVPVQVTGTVETFVLNDIETEYGLDLDPNLYTDYEQQPVIVAKSVALAPTPEDLFEAPTNYFDQRVAVEGDVRKLETATADAENTEIMENAFALFEAGWIDDVGVLVVGVNRTLEGGPIQEGENVVAVGTARQADAALLQEANLGWDDNQIQEFLSRYTDRPVIVADEVYPSAVDPAPES